ncbi:hypothetical protein [Roseateles depolymerans]|uniref:hypothetical protein n=2 Tax=Roseateles depolymerans TaxID=76731 RepID=UPI001473F7B6|nr:hypothetical protein [Roseateles depolymerans]
MSMLATFISAEAVNDWHDAARVVLGTPTNPTAAPVAAVGIRSGTQARWRVDLFASVGYSCFQDVRGIGELVYIGYGEQVAVFSPRNGELVSHSLDGYFGQLFTAIDLESPELGSSVLVASASELLRFDGTGRLLWRMSELGIDGVVVHRVQDGRIFGDAEWDPPGGWKPFRLHLDSGEACPD